MPAYTQAASPLRVATGLGPDAVLLTGVRGTEGLSRLFEFELDLIAPVDHPPVEFAGVLGKPALVEIDLANGETRVVHGLVNRFRQVRRDDRFAYYRADLVPDLWLLTRREQSRVFQHVTAKDILTAVLTGLAVRWAVEGEFAERDFCAQYRETDFAFASRLMEEEGIYYYFAHAPGGHTLVLADTPAGHARVPAESTLVYEQAAGGNRPEFLVTAWEKVQELRSGRVTLWDHNFELPNDRLDAAQDIPETVRAGTVSHSLKLGPTPGLERYTYPGGYADWFDGVDRGGSEQPADLARVFGQNRRLALVRAQEEAAPAVRVSGASVCPNLTAGHAFTLA